MKKYVKPVEDLFSEHGMENGEIMTTCGPAKISFDYADRILSVYCRFKNVDEAQKFSKTPYNIFTGKYNHHFNMKIMNMTQVLNNLCFRFSDYFIPKEI